MSGLKKPVWVSKEKSPSDQSHNTSDKSSSNKSEDIRSHRTSDNSHINQSECTRIHVTSDNSPRIRSECTRSHVTSVNSPRHENERFRNHIESQSNVSIINMLTNIQPSEDHNYQNKMSALPSASNSLHGSQMESKNTTDSKQQSKTSNPFVSEECLVCNTVSHKIKSPCVVSDENVMTSLQSITSSSDHGVSPQLLQKKNDKKVEGNNKELSLQNLQQNHSCLTSNHNNFNETNNNESEFPCDVKQIMKPHLMNEMTTANISSINGAHSEELQIKHLSNGCGAKEVDNSDVTTRANKCINLPKTDIKNGQGNMMNDVSEELTLEDVEKHNFDQEGRQNLESGSSVSYRRHKTEKVASAEGSSGDSSDEDIRIYDESFRCSNWVCVDQENAVTLGAPTSVESKRSSASGTSTDGGPDGAVHSDGETLSSATVDDVFLDPLSQPASHTGETNELTDSLTPTASDSEFKHRYMSRRKCLIQRADSQQEYHRLSSRMYDQSRQVVIERIPGCEDLGLHLLDSYPAYITSVDPGSAAEKAGVIDGQILVSVNDHNVLTTNHADIVKLIHSMKGSIVLGVASSDFQPVRNLQAAIMSGHMLKLGNSGLKIWKRRFFILRQDNCLYYYRSDQETDPRGAFPLGGYTISRHSETNKEFCFKAEKFGGRTYYFCVDNRDQMTAWVGALGEASVRQNKRKESFLSVSSHNVGLSAHHIMSPECAGFLSKLSPSRYAWRRRYCVLKDACVYYYKDKNSSSALGVIHLHGYRADAENYQRRKYSFSLQPPEQTMRVFAFCADNETDKKRWVELLTSSIKRWVQSDIDIGSVDQP